MSSFAEYYRVVRTSTGSLEIYKIRRNENQIQSDCSFRFKVRILVPRVDSTEEAYN